MSLLTREGVPFFCSNSEEEEEEDEEEDSKPTSKLKSSSFRLSMFFSEMQLCLLFFGEDLGCLLVLGEGRIGIDSFDHSPRFSSPNE